MLHNELYKLVIQEYMTKVMLKRLNGKIREVGWKKLPLEVCKEIYQTKHHFKYIIQSEIIAHFLSFKPPTFLLLSNPRSGSSWIGKILSYSPDIAYLREPVTQTLLQKLKYERVIINPSDKSIKKEYTRLSDRAFAGAPPLYHVMGNVTDFYPFARGRKHLLIKEVNPLASGFFSKRYNLKMIILLRHPAGIADSYIRMGWLKDNFEDFGYRYGMNMLNALRKNQNQTCKVINYEAMAENPFKKFLDLYDFMELEVPANYGNIIEKYCMKKNGEWKPYQSKRSSAKEIYKWKQNLDKNVIEEIKKGYLRSGLNYYNTQDDWMI